MPIDAVRTGAQPLPTPAWVPVAVLLVLLGALGLLLIGCNQFYDLDATQGCPNGTVLTSDGMCKTRKPNYYACNCECTKGYSVNARVSTNAAINVRPSPAGTPPVGQAPANSLGTIINGPVQATLNGMADLWWEVTFDGAVVDGWVAQSLITVVSSDPLVAKDLQVCLPPKYNANLGAPPFDHSPSPAEVDADCGTDRVEPAFGTVTNTQLPAGSTCTCGATTAPTEWDSSCDADCTDPSGVCLLAGADPPEPTPDVLAASTVLRPTSLCEVHGTATLSINGSEDTITTPAHGLVQIHGRPCASGQTCEVSLSYQLRFDNFSIPVEWHSDPVFTQLSISGASQPFQMGPFLFPDLHVGNVPTGASMNSARGARLLALGLNGTNYVVVGTNGGPIGVSVDWVNKHCLLDGNFLASAKDDDGNTASLSVFLSVGGLDDAASRLLNQPPRPNAGADKQVECTSPQGAPVALTAAGSIDLDDNIAFYSWRRDSDTGPYIALPSPSPSASTQQALGDTTYVVRVVDSGFASDTDAIKVSVVDSTPPTIACNTPAGGTIVPASAPISFKATAEDLCTPVSGVAIQSYECFEVKPGGRIVRKESSCKVALQGDTIRILDSGGVNTTIRWQVRASDTAGNTSPATACEVFVAHP